MAGKGTGKIQALEASFGQAANKLYEKLLDLNTTTPALLGDWDKILDMRDALLTMYGVPVAPRTSGAKGAPVPAGKGKGPPPGWGAPPAAAAGDIDWKSNLLKNALKKLKKTPEKGDCTVEVEQQDGGFVAALTCVGVEQVYQNDGPATSKKQAEQLAARAALRAEFPEAAAALEGPAAGGAAGWDYWSAGAWAMGPGAWAAPAAGQKRKAEKPAIEEKSLLGQAMDLLLGRAKTKEDIVYDTKAVDGSAPPEYISTVTVPGYDAQLSAQGDKAESKKAAENSAAKKLLAQLKDTLEPIEEEHKAKKARINKEKLGKLKEAYAAKKQAAKEAKEGAEGGLADGAVAETQGTLQ